MPNLQYEDYLEGTAKVLYDSRKEKEPYEVEVLGKKFVVFPSVFSPKYFFDTEFFAKEIDVNEGEEFLEIGSGTGIISVILALKGAKVTCTDINPMAIKNTKENAQRHNIDITILEGDVYDPLQEDKKFDTIFWNTPFGFVEGELDNLEKAVFDKEYKATERFIKESKKYLKPNGRLLIGFSSTLGRLDLLQEYLKEAGFTMKEVAKIPSMETHPVFFELYEAVSLS